MDHGADAAIAKYHELKSTRPNDYNFNEDALNGFGYGFLEENGNSDALAIFKLDVEEHPKSGNVFNRLAGACAKGGQKR